MKNNYKYIIVVFVLFIDVIFVTGQNIDAVTKKKIDDCILAAKDFETKNNLNQAARQYIIAGQLYWNNNALVEAIAQFEKAYEFEKKKGNLNALQSLNSYMGMIYNDLGNFEEAYFHYNASLEICRRNKDELNTASQLINLSNVLANQKKYAEANKNLTEVIEIANKHNQIKMLRTAYSLLAENSKQMGNTQASFEYFNFFLTFDKLIKDEELKQLKQKNEIELAFVNAEKKEKELALELEKIKLAQTTDSLSEMEKKNSQKELEISVLKKEQELKNLRISEQQARMKADNIFKKTVFIILFLVLIFSIVLIYQIFKIRKTNKLLQDQAQLLETQNIELEKLSIVASETSNAVMILDKYANFEWVNSGFRKLYGFNLEQLISEKGKNFIQTSHNENLTLQFQDCIKSKEPIRYESLIESKSGELIWTQTTVTPVLDAFGNITKFVAIDTDINELKAAQQAIIQQKEEILVQKESLAEKNIQIMLQNQELQEMFQKLDDSNQKIKSSIEYAQTIQRAILPSVDFIKKFYDIFIIYKPKDIVSGDFYWFTELLDDESLIHVIAVVDCTGHGVPGAFMSMIGSSLLSEIVNVRRITSPDRILEVLNEEIIRALRQVETGNDDGMEAGICKIQNTGLPNALLSFAGAKNTLYYAKAGINKIEQLEDTRHSLGGKKGKDLRNAFKCTDILVGTGDCIYLTTDGFGDQNNPERKKFGTSKFLNVLEKSLVMPLANQKIALEDALNEWKQESDQRDDITVVGLQINF